MGSVSTWRLGSDRNFIKSSLQQPFPTGEREEGVQGAPLQPQQTPKGGSGAEQLCFTHGPGGAGENLSLSQTAPFFPPSSFVKIFLHSSIHPPFKKNYIKPLKLEVWCAAAHLEKTTTEISMEREGMEPAVISHNSLAMASPIPAQGHWLLQELQATPSTTEKPTPSPGRTGGTP